MIGLDTNVLVRYLTKDDPGQSARAMAFIRAQARKGETFFLNTIVLCELVWVLESAYNQSKEVIASVLERVLLTEEFQVEARDTVWAALAQYRRAGRADFSDCLIGRKNLVQGCGVTVTFDRALEGEAGFELLSRERGGSASR